MRENLKVLTVKDRPDDNSQKNCKISQTVIFTQKAHTWRQTYLSMFVLASLSQVWGQT